MVLRKFGLAQEVPEHDLVLRLFLFDMVQLVGELWVETCKHGLQVALRVDHVDDGQNLLVEFDGETLARYDEV